MIGQKHNRLTVLERVGQNKSRNYMYRCVCDCGNEIVVVGSSLVVGNTKSCGCMKLEKIAKVNYKHGLTKTAEHKIWSGLKQRCYNTNNHKYEIYGGRGITVCERWLSSFDNFLEDMGNRPSEVHSIDRIDVNGNYEPSNCRWATDQEQARNRNVKQISRLGIKGITQRGNKYRAYISLDLNKRTWLGTFDTIEEAVQAREKAEQEWVV